ncbi:TPA: hypothetical protein KKL10_003898 [Escherichia coli]|nr:hypothetical protein [Escherichia coli]
MQQQVPAKRQNRGSRNSTGDKNQDLFQAPAIRIYLFCQSSGWQVMRTQKQKEENTGERQTQI